MWLIKAALRNPYMVATIVFMILFLGIISLSQIPIDILPVFKSPAVQVITYYQGMPASSIEKTITNRIERWVNQSPGAMLVTSKSVPGVSIVRVYFRDDIDLNGALTMTGQLALGTLPTLPPNTLPPVVLPFDPTATMPLGVLTVSNPFMDEANVKDVARIQVRNALGAVKGCVAPVVVGGKDRTILVYLDPSRMEPRHISATDPEYPSMNVYDLLNVEARGQNQKTPVKLSEVADFVRRDGAVEISHDSLTPVFNVQLNLEERDIGHVAADIEQALKHLKTPAGLAWETKIDQTNGAEITKLVKAVHNGEAPKAGYHWETGRDGTAKQVKDEQSKYVVTEGMRWQMRGEYERMNESFANLAKGLAGAVVLVYLLQVALFRSWIGPFIIMFTVPLGLIGVVFMLWLTGTSLNVQSEMGAIFLVGIEVNTGVLMVSFADEQRRAHNLTAKDAIVRAATIRFRPILMTFFACFIDLIPMAIGLERGSEANVPLARAVIGGLLCSTLLSRFVLPVLYTMWVRDGAPPEIDFEKELSADWQAPSENGVAGRGLAPVEL